MIKRVVIVKNCTLYQWSIAFAKKKLVESYLTNLIKHYKNVLSDLLTGFKELLNNNLVHHDLKPENILINDNVFKVADYGFGKHKSNFKQIL